ncbi:hypothetical protein EBR66_02950 [bacterium]|nr:hypothetical protein [bacterium]
MHAPSLSTTLAVIASDWFIILAFFTLVALDAMRGGAGRAVTLGLTALIAPYLFSLLSQTFLLSGIITAASTEKMQALVFGGIFVVTYLAVRRMTISYGDFGIGIVSSLCAALGATALMLLMWNSVPALGTLWHFGSVAEYITASYFFWIIVGSFSLLSFARG